MSSPQLNSNHCIALFTILVVTLLFSGCPPDDGGGTRERVVLIFSDVTSSLVPSESKQVAALTSSVVDSLVPGTRYYVYPVQIEAQKLEPLDEGTILLQDAGMTEAVKKARRDKLSQEITALYDQIKTVRRRPVAYGSPDNQTCILYTLQFAQDKFKQFDRKNTDFELVYVSDMIEQCNETPMHKPISLAQTNLSEAIKLAQETDLKVDLSYANVSMIIPATTDTYKTGGRPNLSDLRSFWEATLLHCGFNKDSLSSDQKFYFASGLPIRFQPQQN